MRADGLSGSDGAAFGLPRTDPILTIARWGWRYRHELAPAYAAVGLATAAGLGHDLAPFWWPLGLPLGAALTAAAWHWRADRTPERIYVPVVGSAATVWTTVAWWLTPGHGWLMLAAVFGVVAASVPRWWHYHRRGKLIVKAGALREARRELRRMLKNWPELAEYMELMGSHVQRAEADETGFVLTLELRAGLTAADVMDKLGRVESVLQTRPGAARLEPDPDRADRIALRIVRNDPLAAPIPWPGSMAASITEPLAVGRFANGELVRLGLVGEHMLIGASG